MSLKISLLTLRELLALGRFQPASVQREFQWGSVEAARLFADLTAFMRPLGLAPDRDEPDLEPEEALAGGEEETPGEEEGAADPEISAARRAEVAGRRPRPAPDAQRPDGYFLGQMVLTPAPRAEGVLHLYDGYQRLTSLLCLLSALRARAADPALVERLSALLGSDEEPARRRLAAPTRAGTLALLIGPPARARLRWPRSGATEVDRRLIEVRDAFAQRVAEWDDAAIEVFLGLLLDAVSVSVIETPNRSTAYQIFVGANARGRTLAVSDVVKGKIIELIDRSDGPAVAERYSQTWSARRKKLKKSFDPLLAASEFLRYLPSEPYAPGSLLLAEIDAAEERPAFEPGPLAADLKAWIDDALEVHAASHQRLRRHFAQEIVRGGDVAVRRLSFLSWDEWLPAALQIDLQFGEAASRRRWAGLLFALQRTCYVLDLLDWSEAGRRERMARAVRQLQAGKSPLSFDASAEGAARHGAFTLSRRLKERAFARLDGPLTAPEKRGPVVRLLETLQWPDGLARAATDDADVEHVLPQALKGGWEAVFSRDEHEYWCNRLGNLCILDKDTNYQLQTALWPEKRRAYQRWNGAFRSAAAVAEAEVWAAGDVAARHRAAVAQLARHLRIEPAKARAANPAPAEDRA